MSFPNIPNITPQVSIDKDNCTAMLLASVALEELGLSHIINSEAEKIQYVLGTLEGQSLPKPVSHDELLEVTNSVSSTLRDVLRNKLLLNLKMEDIIRVCGFNVFTNTVTVTADYDGGTVSANDKAYYHTLGGAVL